MLACLNFTVEELHNQPLVVIQENNYPLTWWQLPLSQGKLGKWKKGCLYLTKEHTESTENINKKGKSPLSCRGGKKDYDYWKEYGI